DGGGIFIDGKIDDSLGFKIGSSADSCAEKGNIDGFPHSGSGGDGKNTANATATVKLHLFHQSSATGNTSCIEDVLPLQLSDPSHNFGKYFTWVDSGTISTSDGATMIFQQAQGTTGTGDYLGTADG